MKLGECSGLVPPPTAPLVAQVTSGYLRSPQVKLGLIIVNKRQQPGMTLNSAAVAHIHVSSFSCAQSGRAAVLLGLPTLSCLGYEAYHWVQSSAVVHALQKGSLFTTGCSALENHHPLIYVHSKCHFLVSGCSQVNDNIVAKFPIN